MSEVRRARHATEAGAAAGRAAMLTSAPARSEWSAVPASVGPWAPGALAPRWRGPRPPAMARSALLALAVALAACAGDAPEAEAPATVSVRAVFVAPLYDGAAATVDHEAVPGWMPAMRMDLRVASPALLDGLAGGDPVRLTLDSLSLEVVGVEPLPPGTALTLAPDAPGVSFDADRVRTGR